MNVEIADKEVLVPIGPSGCGKSMALHLLSGLEYISIKAQMYVTELIGNEIFLHMLTGENSFVARIDPCSKMIVGQTAQIAIDMDRFHLFDAETEEAIRYQPCVSIKQLKGQSMTALLSRKDIEFK
jgi:multiple sugar transport system ATP-binding protein